MTHKEYKKLQQIYLDKVVEILKQNKNVIGITIGGSIAKGKNDGFSDIDAECYLNTDNKEVVSTIYNRVGDVSPLLCKLFTYGIHALYLFEDGIRFDLDIIKPNATVFGNVQPFKILYNPIYTLEQALHSQEKLPQAPRPQWNENDGEYIDWFFWMFRQIYCWTKRSEQGGNRAFQKLINAIQSLEMTRNKLVEMRYWSHPNKLNPHQLDTDFAAVIQETFPHFDPQEVLEATKKLLFAYEMTCPEYCNKVNKSYPSNKVEIIKGLLKNFDSLT